MIREKRMKAWVELEAERRKRGICRQCFNKTLEMVLTKKHLKQMSGIRQQTAH